MTPRRLVAGSVLGALRSSSLPGARHRPVAADGGRAAELATPAVRTSIASQRIYFVLTDRYANGDTRTTPAA